MVLPANGERERFHQLCRRRFIQAAAAGGVLLGASGPSSAQEGTLQLNGATSGWVGRLPTDIEGETNPALALEAGRNYTLSWTNADGIPHTFAIVDDEGDDVVGPTDQVSEEGETQTVEFVATEDMVEYRCTIHPQSMRGAIEIVQPDDGRAEPVDTPPLSVRDLDNQNYEMLYTYRKRRALEVLLSDPEVNDAVDGMVASFEAYDPHANHLDAISVQGSPSFEIEGGIDEGEFVVTARERRVAFGLVERRTDELVALTVTDPQDVSWRAWQRDDLGAMRLRRVIEEPRVGESLENNDWYPLFVGDESITSARGIEHGGVAPVVLIVDADGEIVAVSAYLDVREDDAGEVIDVNRVERFVEFPPHELAGDLVPEDDTVLGEVPDVTFERRPWYTANDGVHRIEKPDESFDRSEWSVNWERPGRHGVELAVSYRGQPVFARLDAPVTYVGYNLPERNDESTLEWFFPDGNPVFSGDLLHWDVHSLEFGGPGAIGVIEYPEEPDRPEGFRFRSQYYTGVRESGDRAIHSGHRFGTSDYDISYDFWADGVFMPVWRRNGPGFVTEYAGSEEGVTQHHVAGIAMDVTPGEEVGPEVHVFDGNEWTTPETEFYRVGEPGTIVRFSNPDGPETIDLPLDRDTEVVVVRRGPREIPTQQRVEDPGVEASFYHPAQYVGGEPIQGERVIVWLLMEAATGQMPHPAGITSFVTRAELRLSGY